MMNNNNNMINTAFTRIKRKIEVSFSYIEIINKEHFIYLLKSEIYFGAYTAFIRSRYNSNRYAMCGNQILYEHNIDNIDDFYNNIRKRVKDFMADYNLEPKDIVYFQIVFYPKVEYPISDLTLHKDFILFDTPDKDNDNDNENETSESNYITK